MGVKIFAFLGGGQISGRGQERERAGQIYHLWVRGGAGGSAFASIRSNFVFSPPLFSINVCWLGWAGLRLWRNDQPPDVAVESRGFGGETSLLSIWDGHGG